MERNKNIKNKNDKGKIHGYQEVYSRTNKLDIRVVYKNGLFIGYRETHQWKTTRFQIR